MNKNASTLLMALMIVLVISPDCAPAASASYGGSLDSNLPTYIAQNDQSESGEDQQSEETVQSGQSEEAAPSDSSGSNGDSSAAGSGERVGLATVFVHAIGTGILALSMLALVVSGNFLLCGLVWKIGMVARGGKKPEIG